MSKQNLRNHVRFVPLYHFFVLPVLIGNFLTRVYFWMKAGFGLSHFFPILLAAALFVGILYARLFALAVQNRLIRLEERLRYENVLSEELRWLADGLTVDQFVSLRFASDDELPALMRKVLDEKVTSRKAIKQSIKDWRPDYLRA
ncbi:MAG TPA: DUF6526 family protein [Candidatus Acidoferrum sp.]|nr:DUF6526 family protein [Candidatus Acidoferrum sp.]